MKQRRIPAEFSGPEFVFEVFLADVDAELVENFDHVVVRNWGIRSCRAGDSWKMDESIHEPEFPEIKLRRISAYQNFLKLNFEGSLTSDPVSDIAGNRRAVVSSRD
jgi:hypothetical protein